MHPKVWSASGHLSGFSDPLVDCLISKERFRADKEIVLLALINSLDFEGLKHVDKKLLLDGEFLLSILQKLSDEKIDIYLTSFIHAKSFHQLI